MQLFSEKSEYAASVPSDVQVLQLNAYLPAQTKLSTKLQKMWLRLAPLSTIDDNVRDFLPWLLMHHSIFVKITKFRSVFAAFVLYYQKNCPLEMRRMLGSLQLAQETEPVQ